jgi:hypothetical protein
LSGSDLATSAGTRRASLQNHDLFRGQIAPLAGFEETERERINLYPNELPYLETERIGNAPDLPFTPFAHCYPNPGHIFVFVACHQLEIDRLCRAVVEHHATPPDIECLVGDLTLQRHLVHFGMPITWMAEFLGQFTIVGQQHQSLAVGIKPPDRVQMLTDRHEVKHCPAMLLFLRAYRRDNAHRLVEHYIDPLTLDA